MVFHIEELDLLNAPEDYSIAHCLSADLRLNMGIVVQINRKYDLRNLLKTAVSETPVDFPGCIVTGKVINLITKAKYNLKPGIDDLTQALVAMRREVEACGVRKIAMPKIGCGLDKLRWEDVEARIRQVFADCDDLEIMVCVLPKTAGKRTIR